MSRRPLLVLLLALSTVPALVAAGAENDVELRVRGRVGNVVTVKVQTVDLSGVATSLQQTFVEIETSCDRVPGCRVVRLQCFGDLAARCQALQKKSEITATATWGTREIGFGYDSTPAMTDFE
jgi:hypothetical protein